jgi:hypothetical protein
MNMEQRLDARWQAEIQQLGELAARTGGRLQLGSTGLAQGVTLQMECVSAFRQDGPAPAIRQAWHSIELLRREGWPALPVTALYVGPPGIFHPNILAGAGDIFTADPVAALQQFYGTLLPGMMCYGHAWPGMRLVDVVGMLYNMLGYRFGAFARQGEHFNIEAIRWVQEKIQDPAYFPLERRALTVGRR